MSTARDTVAIAIVRIGVRENGLVSDRFEQPAADQLGTDARAQARVANAP